MPGKRLPFKDSKMLEFIQMLLKATKEGKELSSRDMQTHFGFDVNDPKIPNRWGSFKTHVMHRIADITGGAVSLESRRVTAAYYRLEGDITALEVELELRTMPEEERAELLKWAIEEKHRREAEGEPQQN